MTTIRRLLAFCLTLTAACGAAEHTPDAIIAVPADQDEDGVANEKDRCPTKPGPLENQGCPYESCAGDIGKTCWNFFSAGHCIEGEKLRTTWCVQHKESAFTTYTEGEQPSVLAGTTALYAGVTPKFIAASAIEEEVVSWQRPSGSSGNQTLWVPTVYSDRNFRTYLILPQDSAGVTITTRSGKGVWIISTDFESVSPPMSEPDPSFEALSAEKGFTYRFCTSPCRL